jgi:hypothetical protein
VRQGQALGPQLDLSEQQQVQVEGPGPMAGPCEGAAVLDLDPFAEVEQLLGLERSADADGGVEEVRLVEDLPNRLGLIGRGDRLDLDPMTSKVLDRPVQMLLALPDVGAETDVADPLGAFGRLGAQTPPSSSSMSISRAVVRSRVNSTAASCTW